MKKIDTKAKILEYVGSLTPEEAAHLYEQLKHAKRGHHIMVLRERKTEKRKRPRKIKKQSRARKYRGGPLSMPEFLALEL